MAPRTSCARTQRSSSASWRSEPVPPSPLGIADFRRLVSSTVLASVGMMGEVVVLGWLTLDLTNSPFLVGVAMGARALPLAFVGLPAGVLADRVPRGRLLMTTSAGQAVIVAILGALAALDVVTYSHVVGLTVAAGAIRGVEHATRQSYTHDVVGGGDLVNGLAILGVAMRGGWLVGALGAGAAIAHLGVAAAYGMLAVAYLAGAAALLGATLPTVTTPSGPRSVWQSVTGFAASLRHDRTLLRIMLLTAGAEVLGFSHQALLPSLARDVLGVGPEGLGVLNAARAVGGIVGLVAVTTARPAGSGTQFVVILLAFGASVVGLGVAPLVVGFAGVVALVIIVNGIGALADLLAQSLMQLSVPADQRGRAGGAWVVAIGLAPLGQLQIGALASLFGVGLALGASGLALVALAAAASIATPRPARR